MEIKPGWKKKRGRVSRRVERRNGMDRRDPLQDARSLLIAVGIAIITTITTFTGCWLYLR